MLNCGHTLKKKCYESSTCNQICNKSNSDCLFRHLCKKLCGVTCGPCTHLIPIVMNCGHISEFSCSQELDSIECLKCKNVKNILSCGHLVSTIHNDVMKFNDQVCKHEMFICIIYIFL